MWCGAIYLAPFWGLLLTHQTSSETKGTMSEEEDRNFSVEANKRRERDVSKSVFTKVQ